MTDLLARQGKVRAEAEVVLAELGLTERLATAGEPTLVGSAALGLMVRRDLDLTVTCPALDPATHAKVIAIGAGLAADQRVREVTFRNDTGAWNTDPRYPDGLYLGLRYRADTGQDWTLDLWFVDEPDRQPDLEHLRTLAPRLDDTSRARILEIKTALAARPRPGPSFEVYRAVLDHGVSGTEAFDAWRLSGRPEPGPVPGCPHGQEL
ncbi:hypothetical protein [Crossiella sp. NPDC003009]